MRGGQPPLAPKSSHKVLRSFPPPHRLRGKPLKIPQKTSPTHRHSRTRHTQQPRHCKTSSEVVAVDYILSIARSNTAINSPVIARPLGRGNPFSPRHCEIFARKSWQSSIYIPKCVNTIWYVKFG
mgnify:CR=1 FL=1